LSVFVHFVVCCTCTRNFGVPYCSVYWFIVSLSVLPTTREHINISVFAVRLPTDHSAALAAAHRYVQTVPALSETVARRYLISNFVLEAYRVLCVVILLELLKLIKIVLFYPS
jgi:hypothetical protein